MSLANPTIAAIGRPRSVARAKPRAWNLRSHALLLPLAFLCIFPIYWMIVTSLRADNEIFSSVLWPENPSLKNYEYVLNAVPMMKMLFNTFYIAVASTILQVLTGLMAAYVCARWTRVLGKWMLGLLTITWLIPPQVIMIPNFVLVNQMGLMDTLSAVIAPQIASAFAVMMIYQAIRSFPQELIESAQLDGASHVRILFGIITPNIKPILASVSIILFISTWNEYFWPLLVNRSMDNAVIQIGLQMFMTAEGNQWGPLMAAATVASLPILLLYLVLQRQIIDTFVRSGIR